LAFGIGVAPAGIVMLRPLDRSARFSPEPTTAYGMPENLVIWIFGACMAAGSTTATLALLSIQCEAVGASWVVSASAAATPATGGRRVLRRQLVVAGAGDAVEQR